MPLRPESVRRKWERLSRVLAPLRGVERPPSEYGLRLQALEALRQGEGRGSYLLAQGAARLPPEFMPRLVGLSLSEAVREVEALLLAPEVPRRKPDSVAEARLRGRIFAVFWGMEAQGLLTRERALYVQALAALREEDLHLLRVYLKAAGRVYGEPGPRGEVVYPPHFFTGLEDLTLLWREVALAWGFLDPRSGRPMLLSQVYSSGQGFGSS